jgi:hypothetical protein
MIRFRLTTEKSVDFGHRFRLRLLNRIRYRNPLIRALLGLVVCFALFNECFLPRNKVSRHLRLKIEEVICPQSPLANDILVVVRTGATEAHEKLPIHFNTTLRCVPDYVIYSDYEEDIQGHHVHDVLNEVSDALKTSVTDFELYERLKSKGRNELDTAIHLGSGPSGSLENPSWKLDKFKFLPMMDKALRHRPSAKWFVFIEADTYLVWENLLEYMTKFDSNRELYLGKHMYIGDVLFAHGGSGFVLSAAAMRKVTEHWRSHVAEYDKYTTESWAGDMILGKALRDVNVQLFWAFPHFQGDPVSSLDHNVSKVDRRPWCYAPITYHHMRGEEIQKLWAFEQAHKRKGKGVLLHRDVFKEYIVPGLASRIDAWDNLSLDPQPSDQKSLGECHAACEAKLDCLQYSYTAGKCSTSTEIRYGNEAKQSCAEYSVAASKCVHWQEESQIGDVVQSGWMIARLPQYMEEMDSLCQETENAMWII